jgi:hypothetical protein
MKQADAKREIIILWSKRDRNRLTLLDILAFYEEIHHNHPELLQFKYRGHDKYQIVRSWLEPYVI